MGEYKPPELPRLASQCYEAYKVGHSGIASKLKDSPEELEGIKISNDGFLVLIPNSDKETIVLLYREGGGFPIEPFVFHLLPSLLFNRQKKRLVGNQIYALLRSAQEESTALKRLLSSASRYPVTLGKIERLSVDLSTQHGRYIQILADLEHSAQTLRVAVSNLSSLLGEAQWGINPLREDYLLGDVETLLQQMESELVYLRMAEHTTKITMESLRTGAEVSGVRWERWITLLLLGLSLTGIANAFMDELNWWWRLALILAGIPVVVVGYYWSEYFQGPTRNEG
jgi:hypothetical protein